MSIVEKAVDVASTLDPSLGLELEQEFGEDWRQQLAKEIDKLKDDKKTTPGPIGR